MLRTSAPSAFPRFWLDERCFSLAHKEFRKRKKKCSEKILNSYLLSNQSSYIQYFWVPWLPLVLHVQLTTVGHFWPGLERYRPLIDFGTINCFQKFFAFFFSLGTVPLPVLLRIFRRIIPVLSSKASLLEKSITGHDHLRWKNR